MWHHRLHYHRFQLPWFVYVWFFLILGLFAAVDHLPWRVTAFLVPPFGATLSLIVSLPQQHVSQPFPIIAGGTVGAGIGSLIALWGHGPFLAALAALVAFVILPPLGMYFPPAVAFAIFPVLIKTSPWFPFLSVFPFTVVATGSSALLSRYWKGWPSYPYGSHAEPLSTEKSL
ncbi:HPP family protein [Sulfobacillus sp. hq2]|uniref:HPP transmembrane region domain-containing protein n=1 Tax=Sulfobacillus thermotolerans TaxID=338644 RepID=A0ABN5GXS7_9FIRM|nr:HPP family protein [Sulfobacillus sp. hq2]AUW93337.1 hypothetical protein BXT84_04685 [Sulfobacillus thermotolerans]MCY0908641.1 HPP family protein [Sulfobacillus thermotolerans]